MSSFFLLFYCDGQKFNMTGGFFIFLFMVTGRGIIFICSAVYECIGKRLAVIGNQCFTNRYEYIITLAACAIIFGLIL